MRRIMIADDDVIVRRYLEQVIQNEMQEYELCGVAKNGKEALKVIREQQPDLAIIDIDMPEKDGVEVLYDLNKGNLAPDTKVVVLSCYNDFEYVKNAMKYGAVDYILKYKVDSETLARTLEAVFADAQSIEIVENTRNASKALKQQDKMLRQLLFNENTGKDNSINFNDWAEALNIMPGNLLVAVGMLDYHDKFIIHNTDDGIRQVNFHIMDIIRGCARDCRNILAACIDEDKYVLIFSYHKKQISSAELQYVERMLSDIKDHAADKLQMTITFGVSGAGGNITNIAAYYNKALDALKYKLYMGTNKIIMHSDCVFSEEIPEDLYHQVNQWSQNLLFSGESNEQLEKLFAELSTRRPRYSQYNLLLMRMVGAVINDVGDSYSMNRVFGDFDISMVFVGCETCLDHYHWFVKHIKKLRENKKEQKCRDEIVEAIKYIEENLSENLTLSSVAEHVNFSKNYFSQLFKKNVGENLVDYIARLRINRAKELLVNSDYKVYEVAVEVGFESQHYFNKLFKNLVGVTPTEYRNIKCFS